MPKVSVVDFQNQLIQETVTELNLIKNPLYIDDEIGWIDDRDLPRMSMSEIMDIQKTLDRLDIPGVFELLEMKKWDPYSPDYY